jgi:hypothetical protein
LGFAVFLTAGLIYGAGAVIMSGAGWPAVRLPSTADRTASVPSPTVTVAIAAATPSSTPEQLVTPSATPTPSPPWIASRYRLGGRNYVGLEVQAGTAISASFAGRTEVRLYQFIDGEVRVGSNVPSLAFFPYVTVTSADRRMTYRPGALTRDTELVVRDGQLVAIGESLFRVTGEGRSSWATFYDARVPFQVVVSLQAMPSGRELDAFGYFVDQ